MLKSCQDFNLQKQTFKGLFIDYHKVTDISSGREPVDAIISDSLQNTSLYKIEDPELYFIKVEEFITNNIDKINSFIRIFVNDLSISKISFKYTLSNGHGSKLILKTIIDFSKEPKYLTEKHYILLSLSFYFLSIKERKEEVWIKDAFYSFSLSDELKLLRFLETNFKDCKIYYSTTKGIDIEK